jgi:general secretion pathway protein B
MSFILEALRRAESEREQGRVPGLHAQALSSPRGRRLSPAGSAIGLWLALGLSMGALAGLVWWTWLRPPAAVQVTTAPAAATSSADLAAALPAAAMPATARRPLPDLAPPQAQALGKRPTSLPRTADPAGASGPTDTSGGSVKPRAVAAEPADLPETLRGELPRIVVNGSVFSDDPASRFVIVNGEVAHEGDTVAPGLVIERIRPRDLWLRFRGFRVRQPL